MLDAACIAALLEPFVDASLPADLAPRLQTYLELLLRWNARTNLSAVREPEQIVTRHFGESLFAARILRNAGAFDAAGESPTLSDIGSGAGFPGIPIKLFAPKVHITLMESQNKKATFLREVIRTLNLTDAEVFYGRAETWSRTARTVTLRAVERFDRVLPVAAGLVAAGGILCLLIGEGQVGSVQANLNRDWSFRDPVFVPLSQDRTIYVGNRR
jgi:16S rRNA (guanine527-N7)-methyltransferase